MKKNKLNNWLILLLVGITFISCDDVLEEDITDDNITLIAPAENDVIASNSASFQWSSLEGTTDYRIQINNDSNVVVLDSLVDSSTFAYPLNPGAYSWRVRGENFAYQTAYSFPINFTMVTNEDLTNQTVTLLTPTDNNYINSTTGIITTWSGITAADSYTFELEQNISGSITTMYQEPGITSNTHGIDPSYLIDDAEYVWKVKALNATTATATIYSSRSLFLDTQIPNTPTLSLPADNDNSSGAITFLWDNGSDFGTIQSPITSSLEIANDAGFTSIVDSYQIIGETQIHTFAATGTYYWRVKNIDAATNESNYSTPPNTLIIN